MRSSKIIYSSKILFISIFLLLIFFGSAIAVFAQFDTATGVPVSLSSDYPQFTQPSVGGLAGMIASIYTYALSIAGVLAIVMIVYGGISYAMQPGNTAKQNDAKDIMQSAVWGIVLLTGAYVVLKAINPDLVVLRNPGFQTVTSTEILDLGEIENDTGGTFGGTAIPCTTSNTDLQKTASLAKEILSMGVLWDTNATCGMGTGPLDIVRDVSTGDSNTLPHVCDWTGKPRPSNDTCPGIQNTICPRGGPNGNVTVCPALLEGIKGVQTNVNKGTAPKFVVVSITGGLHETINFHSTHYEGRGMDIVPYASGDQDAWKKLMVEFSQYAGNAPFEYRDATGSTKFIKLGEDISPGFCTGCSNRHIHINFGGAGTMNESEMDTVQTQAEFYLKMNPNLLAEGSYGVPPKEENLSCSKSATSPRQNIIAVAEKSYLDGARPLVCDGSILPTADEIDQYEDENWTSQCKCNLGGQNGNVSIHGDVFKVLIAMEEVKALPKYNLPPFQVVAITGGIQPGETNIDGSLRPSRHYSGTSFDIVPESALKSTNVKGKAQEDFEKIKNFVENDIKDIIDTKKGYFAQYEYIVVDKSGFWSFLDGNFKFSMKFSDNIPSECSAVLLPSLKSLSDPNYVYWESAGGTQQKKDVNPCGMLRLHVIAHQG